MPANSKYLCAAITSLFSVIALPSSASAQESETSENRHAWEGPVSSLINDAATRMENDDYAAARDLYQQALALLPDEEAQNTTLSPAPLRQFIEESLARTIGRGNLGDACPHYETALQLGHSNVSAFARHSPPEYLSDKIESYLALETEARTVGCAIESTRAIDPELAGDYYIRGVMETAGGFRLQPDGVARFYLTVGSLDLMQEGSWTSDGTYVWLNFMPVENLSADNQLPENMLLQISPDTLRPLNSSNERYVRSRRDPAASSSEQ